MFIRQHLGLVPVILLDKLLFHFLDLEFGGIGILSGDWVSQNLFRKTKWQKEEMVEKELADEAKVDGNRCHWCPQGLAEGSQACLRSHGVRKPTAGIPATAAQGGRRSPTSLLVASQCPQCPAGLSPWGGAWLAASPSQCQARSTSGWLSTFFTQHGTALEGSSLL